MSESSAQRALFDRIAGELIRSIQPRRVLAAGSAQNALVQALRDRGIVASAATDSFAQPLDDRYDLIVCLDALDAVPEAGAIAAVRNLAAGTDALLFSSTRKLAWLDLFADQGFAPDIAFDAGFAAPHAMLLRRMPALSGEVSQLFSDCMRWRTAAVESRLQADRLETQLAREREHLAVLEKLQEQLMQEAQNILHSVRGRAPVPAEPLPAGSVSDPNLRAEIERLTEEQSALRAHIARLDRRTTDLDRSIQGVSGRVQSILNSRIWQSLVSASGLLLRLTGQKG